MPGQAVASPFVCFTTGLVQASSVNAILGRAAAARPGLISVVRMLDAGNDVLQAWPGKATWGWTVGDTECSSAWKPLKRQEHGSQGAVK